MRNWTNGQLLRAVLDQMPSDVETSLILNTADLTGLDLLKLIAAEFRLPGPFETRADYLIALNRFLLARLEENGWNISRTAEEIGLARESLSRKMRSFGIRAPRD